MELSYSCPCDGCWLDLHDARRGDHSREEPSCCPVQGTSVPLAVQRGFLLRTLISYCYRWLGVQLPYLEGEGVVFLVVVNSLVIAVEVINTRSIIIIICEIKAADPEGVAKYTSSICIQSLVVLTAICVESLAMVVVTGYVERAGKEESFVVADHCC